MYAAMDGGVLALLVNVSFVAALAIAFFMMRRKLVRLHTRRLRELAAPLLGKYVPGAILAFSLLLLGLFTNETDVIARRWHLQRVHGQRPPPGHGHP